MTHKRKRSIIIGILCGVLVLMVVGYAAFNSVLNIKGTSSISGNWNIKITNIESKNATSGATNKEEPTGEGTLSATFNVDLENPGDSIEYEMTVSNEGNLKAKLSEVTLTDTNNSAIKFTLSMIKDGIEITNMNNIENTILKAGENVIFKVKVEFLKGVLLDEKNLSSNLTVTLDFTQANIDDNGIAIPGMKIEELKDLVVTTGDGLYEDSTETDRYVYKGANPNNYITFNNETWRILAIEQDGTLKIMRKDNIGNRVFESANTRSAAYCNYNQNGCNAWGSSSTMLDANSNHITTMAREINGAAYALPAEDSQMAQYLNDTYYNDSTKLNEESKTLIDNHLWNVGPVASNQTLEPSTAQEKVYKWQGNIGLINLSDFIKSSTDTRCPIYKENCSNGNYLFISENYWTMTRVSAVNSCGVWHISKDSDYGTYGTTNISIGVYPVVYLKADIALSGDGTESSPYTII